MDDRVLAAAQNNAEWCDLVCRAHAIPTAMHDGFWAASRRSPPLYPDAVTLRPDVAAADVLAAVDRAPGCSIKDSFATLDLGSHGFRELFTAQWIWHDPTPSGPTPWTVIDADADLTSWLEAAELTGIVALEALRGPSVRALAIFGAEGIAAGAIANRTGSVVGMSNVFTTMSGEAKVWSALAAAIANAFPSLPLVGYEHGEALDAALTAGFTAIAQLRVWLGPAD